ncbi:MAG: DUF1854 domain-containing protein [Ruminococcaceae bacterium]|nr:DUF1854 domain-containing protein [Oscillospiraceae bacterium]
MPRRYEENLKLTKNINFASLDAETNSGEKFENVTLKRLFPINSIHDYISVISPEGKELFIVKSMAGFEENSLKIAEEFLESFYMIPKILKVYGKKDKFGRLNIDVLTDIGDRTIEIANRQTDIKVREDGRVLFRDINDNRYEVEDLSRLDRRSLAILDSDL